MKSYEYICDARELGVPTPPPSLSLQNILSSYFFTIICECTRAHFQTITLVTTVVTKNKNNSNVDAFKNLLIHFFLTKIK